MDVNGVGAKMINSVGARNLDLIDTYALHAWTNRTLQTTAVLSRTAKLDGTTAFDKIRCCFGA